MKFILSFLLIFIVNRNNVAAQWTRINAIPAQDIVALANIGDTILAATDSSIIYKSNDQGTTWNPITISPGSVTIIDMEVINGIIYLCTSGQGIFSSDDFGATWQQTGAGLLPVSGIGMFGGHIYATTLGNGVYGFSQQTSSWFPFNNALPSYSVNVNAIHCSPNSLLIAAGANGTFYRYDFNANGWVEEYYYGVLKPGLLIQQLMGNGDTLYAVNGNKLIRSENDGITWVDDRFGTHNGFSRIIYSGATYYYTLTNIPAGAGGTWIQKRDKQSIPGTSWATGEEFVPTGYAYDILESGNKLFLAKVDGLYMNVLFSGTTSQMIDSDELIVSMISSDPQIISVVSKVFVKEIEICSLTGQVVYSKQVNKEIFEINPELNRGYYFMRIALVNGHQLTRKVFF